jgi:hypothetical protein
VTDTDRDVYRHYDGGHGRAFAIRRNLDGCPPLAIVDCDPYGSGETALLPQHEVPKAARALYKAAELPVPDLPDIPDPALVNALAMDIHVALECPGEKPYPYDLRVAADLLAKGWGRTS